MNQALYRALMKEAAAQGRTLMQRVVARAEIDMPVHAARSPDVVERNLLADAAKWLLKHEHALCEAYPQALLAGFAQAIAGDGRHASSLSFDTLELMGEDQVQENVDLVRTQQAVQNAVDAELGELNALVCAVQGLKSVRPERNPLRPEIYVRSLHTVTQESPVPASVRRRWLLHLGQAMGPELARAYKELSGMLRSQGVGEAVFDVVVPKAEATQPAPLMPAAASGQQQQKTLLNLRELRRLLSGESHVPEPQAEPSATPDFSATVPAALEALQEMRQVDQVMQRLRQRQAAGGLDAGAGMPALREALRQEARTPAQALGLEVVQLMVENIAGDARLLAPVQDAVRDLEPALLRLALSDPRFFSDKQHPARRLLEEMTQRSLAWPSADTPGFRAFIDPLQQAVEALLDTRVGGAEPFDFALTTLRDAWGDAQQRDKRGREKAVRALLQAEQRNLLAEKFAREMRGRTDIAGVPRPIAHFVTGPWCQVLAQARLSDTGGAADPHGYAAVVPELLWSVQPVLAATNPARLARLAPQLAERIERGLQSIDFPPSQIHRVVDHLAALHREVLQPGAREPAPSLQPGALSREELDAQFAANDEDSAWLAPTEAQHSGFLHTRPSALPKPLFQPTEVGFSHTQPQPGARDGGQGAEQGDAPATEPSLKPGAWIEMFDGAWTRWQLTWASPHGTLCMFTHASGKTQSMTRRLLEKMLANGTVRRVADQAVVDGALDAVAQAALRNSGLELPLP
ncbi:MAG: DUF1631 family protein [Pseudomonadota bacterium]